MSRKNFQLLPYTINKVNSMVEIDSQDLKKIKENKLNDYIVYKVVTSDADETIYEIDLTEYLNNLKTNASTSDDDIYSFGVTFGGTFQSGIGDYDSERISLTDWGDGVVDYELAHGYSGTISSFPNTFIIKTQKRVGLNPTNWGNRKLRIVKFAKDIIVAPSYFSYYTIDKMLIGEIPPLPPRLESANDMFRTTGWNLTGNVPKLPNTLISMDRMFYGCLNLTGSIPELPPNLISCQSAFSGCRGLTGTTPLMPSSVEDCTNIFSRCDGLEYFHGDGWLYGKDVGEAFANCTNIKGTAYNLAEGVEEAGQTYWGCLSEFYAPTYLPSTLYCAEYMFYDCEKMRGTTLNCSNWTDLSCAYQMFYGCNDLDATLEPFGMKNIHVVEGHIYYSMTIPWFWGFQMFAYCRKLKGEIKFLYEFPCFDIRHMFLYCESITSVDMTNLIMMHNDSLKSYSSGFCDGCIGLREIKGYNNTLSDLQSMFETNFSPDDDEIEDNWDDSWKGYFTSEEDYNGFIEFLKGSFPYDCHYSLEFDDNNIIDMSYFLHMRINTYGTINGQFNNCKRINYAFAYCQNINFDFKENCFKSVENGRQAFLGCTNLTSFPSDAFALLEDGEQMFQKSGLTSVRFQLPDTTENAYAMFANTPVSYVNPNLFANADGLATNYCFTHCYNLVNFDTSLISNRNFSSMTGMFYNCENLSIDVSDIRFSDSVKNIRYIFYNTKVYGTFYVPNNIEDLANLYGALENTNITKIMIKTGSVTHGLNDSGTTIRERLFKIANLQRVEIGFY